MHLMQSVDERGFACGECEHALKAHALECATTVSGMAECSCLHHLAVLTSAVFLREGRL
jgi:hypothetical protein